ncbi:MAG: hypothetical protein HS114_34930 [Anaerolineales bacterium]|nr:hypothetical protein [Anaerolineales bacterium]
MQPIKARISQEINVAAVPTITVGTEFTVSLIKPVEGWSRCEGLPVYTVWNFEYELLERPRHQCTNSRCGAMFTLTEGDRCPVCTYPIKEVPRGNNNG